MNLHSSPLVVWTEKGLYCAAGGFHIDPHRAVELAIITHAHSDHARRGSKHYVCESSGMELLTTRLGKKISVTGFEYGKVFKLGDVEVSLHSAGHILGSAQVKIKRGDEIWVASGDYKRDRDPSCAPFENVTCDVFITEATFGTPKFVWEKDLEHGRMIYEWWVEQAKAGRNCLLFGYSLGKAQRILAELAPFAQQDVLIHETIQDLTDCYRRQGRKLAPTRLLSDRLADPSPVMGELILAPPSILSASWIGRVGEYRTAFASGWMQGQGGFGRSRYDKGFVMSDHADWNDLNRTIEESGAKTVYVQHRDGALIRHLRRKGIAAHSIDDLKPVEYEVGENLMLL